MDRSRRLAGLAAAALLASLVVTAPVHAATVRNVPAQFATITAALAASADGDTVLVAPGTYVERITVPPGITVESSGGAEATILDGNRTGPAIVQGTLRGFTIRNHGFTMFAAGGAEVSGLLEDSVVTENGGCGSGSGVQLNGGTIRNNLFVGNVQGPCTVFGVVTGSGIIEGNAFEDNFGASALIYMNNDSPTIDGNVFTGDMQAIYAINTSHPIIRNNLFLVDHAQQTPGFVNISTSAFSPSLTFVNNTLVLLAGGIGPLLRSDSWDQSHLYANNVFTGPAGATLVECATGGDNNPPSFQANDSWTPTGHGLAGTCSGKTGTDGNVSVDPKFVAAAIGDYHLRADSPLIDAGFNDLGVAPDVDGDQRPHDGNEDGTATVDIGMDEAVDPLLFTPAFLDYGDVLYKKSSQLSVTVKNLGGSSLSITSIGTSGTAASNFLVGAQTCTGSALAVNATCTIPVTFTPSALGPRTATLDISGPGAVGNRHLPLGGVGADPIGIAPSSFDFPDTVVGASAISKTFTLTNSGGAAVTITSVTIGGANAGDVSVTSQTCTAAPVAADGTCTITISYHPQSAGDRAATLIVSGPSPVGTRNVALTGFVGAPSSNITWGTTTGAGPSYTWNGGGALGRTVQSGAQRLRLAYATDRVSSAWATDTGPYVGVYYVRNTSGTTWSTPKRLNPSTQHAASLGLAAAGSRVYAIWVSQQKWVNYSPTAARVLYVRVNTSHGASTSWRTAVALSSSTGRVDYPVIAATGTDAHIAWTDAVTGSVKVTSSRDYGVHWTKTAVGSTNITFDDGRTSFPTIAASGSTVAVCWLSDVAGTVKCRVSTDRGVSWGTTTTVGSEATGYFSVAVRSTRVAVVWTTPAAEVVLRMRVGGVWQSPRTVPTGDDFNVYGPHVELQDSNRMAVSWSGDSSSSDTVLRWVESPNGGALWFAATPLSAGYSARHRNDWPSVVWPTAGTRYVVWNGWTENTNYYRLYLRKGTGTASTPTAAGAAWSPAHDPVTVENPDQFQAQTK